MPPRNATLAMLALALPALGAACATRGSPAPPAPAPARTLDFAQLADSIVNTAPLHRAHIGIEVYDPVARRVLYRYNAERHFVPASNEKLWVTTAALHELGPDYRYRTPVLAVGADADGTVRSLIVVGRGDPTMSARFHGRDLAAIDMLADSIARSGIRRIIGDLVIDASAFDRAIIPGAWTYGNLNSTSAPPTGAFVVAEGLVAVTARAGPVTGAPAVVDVVGPRGVMPVLNLVTTTDSGTQSSISVTRGLWSDTLRVSGRAAAGAAPGTTRLPVSDPVRFAAFALAEALRARGIVIDGMTRIVGDSAEAGRLRAVAPTREVTAWVSPPLSEITAAILGPSQNWVAEQLLRTLGVERRGIGSFNAGLAVVLRFQHDVVGIDSAALRLQDGSGMSPQNLITPHAVVQLLAYARTAPWSGVFRTALAAPGKPGTLNSRLRTLEGRLEGKTGTLNSVNALSGYVRTTDGRELIFSIISNASGLAAGPVTSAADKLVLALAEGRLPR